MPPSPQRAAELLRPPATEREQAVVVAVGDLAVGLALSATGVGVLRSGTAVVVGLPEAGVLVRVDDGASRRTAGRQVAVARALAKAGVPAVRLAPVGHQPLAVVVGPGRASVPATAWRWEEVLPDATSPAALGALARQLHRAEVAPEDGVPAADPLAAALEQVEVAAGAGATPVDDLALLRQAAARLQPAWRQVAATQPACLIHGDLHAGNVLATPAGPILVDLELSGIGPAAYDLAPQVVAVRRYGRPRAELDDFLAGYGADLPPAAVLAPMVEAFELWVTAWAVANRSVDADHEAEAELRLARWRPGHQTRGRSAWTLR